MPSQNKLIKNGIQYTDSLFDEISKRLEQNLRASDTLESFLDKYYKAFPDKGNPLVTLGYDAKMLELILAETNNHKFSRPAQKELVRVTIENQVGELLRDVGEDIRDSVRDIVKDGYDNNLSQDEIAVNISSKVSGIKTTRARAIARTEIARASTISDYVINAERGATHFYVECRNTACPICKEAWHEKWTLENDDSFKPSDSSAGGKGWIGDRTYSMSDVGMLPPIHPNCRCVPYFIREDGSSSEPKPEPSPEQLKKNLKPGEREKYNSYKRNIENQLKWLRENPNASSEDIAKHKKRLAFLEKKFDELRVKALGGKDTGGKPKPKPTPKPEPNPEPKPKPKTEEETTKITRKQLEEGLSYQDLKEYDDLTKRLNKIKKLLADDLSKKGSDQVNIDAYKEILKRGNDRLEELRKKALIPPDSELPTPTKIQLRDNLTPDELKTYKRTLKEIKRIREWLIENPNHEYASTRRDLLKMHINQLDTLKKIALMPKEEPKLVKPKEKEKPKQPESKLKFKDLKTPEDVAEYFGFEYSFGDFPKPDKQYETLTGNDGRRYRVGKCENKGKFHKFYDREHDCTIYFAQSITRPSKAKDSKGKIYIDITNSGKGVRNLKDVMQMYWDAPKVLKEANTSITWTNRRAKSLYAYNKIVDKKYEEALKGNPDYEKHISYGKHPAWIDMYINSIEDDYEMGHSMQRTLYHEMAHGLDNLLSRSWTNNGRFSDDRKPGGYATLSNDYKIFDEKTGKIIGNTPKEIVDGISSRYGKDHWRKTFSYSEDFADAISMVSFKNIEDKTGAVILPPDWSWTNRLDPLTYEEWIKEFNHKTEYLEDVLNI